MSRLDASRCPLLCRSAAALAVVAGGAALAEAAPVQFTSTAINQAASVCMTVPGGQPTNALQLQQQSCSSGPSQVFTFTPATADAYTIRTLTSGSCIDISGASAADNAAVIQYTCHTGTNQQFRLQPVS